MAQLQELNPRQIACLQDGIISGTLSRTSAHHDFMGKQAHDSQTVYSLIKKECFTETDHNIYGYPLSVAINKENYIVKNISLLGKAVNFEYKKQRINNEYGTKVIGFGIKDGKLFFKFHTGSNYFLPVESITKIHNEE